MVNKRSGFLMGFGGVVGLFFLFSLIFCPLALRVLARVLKNEKLVSLCLVQD